MAGQIDTLLGEIHRYCELTGTRATTMCKRAVGDARFVARLEAGGQCLPRTMDRVRTYIAANPPEGQATATGEAA